MFRLRLFSNLMLKSGTVGTWFLIKDRLFYLMPGIPSGFSIVEIHDLKYTNFNLFHSTISEVKRLSLICDMEAQRLQFKDSIVCGRLVNTVKGKHFVLLEDSQQVAILCDSFLPKHKFFRIKSYTIYRNTVLPVVEQTSNDFALCMLKNFLDDEECQKLVILSIVRSAGDKTLILLEDGSSIRKIIGVNGINLVSISKNLNGEKFYIFCLSDSIRKQVKKFLNCNVIISSKLLKVFDNKRSQNLLRNTRLLAELLNCNYEIE